jgi:hypothetical protein
VPVDAVRQEVTRILEGSSLRDRKVNILRGDGMASGEVHWRSDGTEEQAANEL